MRSSKSSVSNLRSGTDEARHSLSPRVIAKYCEDCAETKSVHLGANGGTEVRDRLGNGSNTNGLLHS